MQIHKLISRAVIVAAASVSTSVMAAQPAWYVGGDLGWNNSNDVTWTLTSGDHSVPFDDGWMGSLKVGTDVLGVRAEVEYAHRSNDAQYFGTPGSIDPAKGSIKSDALMLNAYYDFTPTGKITPYVGAGIGFAQVQADSIRKNIGTSCCSGLVDDKDTVAAMQLMAGAAYAVSSNLDFTLEYRFFVTKDPSFDYATGCNWNDSISSCGGPDGKTSDSYNNHSIMVGLRYRF